MTRYSFIVLLLLTSCTKEPTKFYPVYPPESRTPGLGNEGPYFPSSRNTYGTGKLAEIDTIRVVSLKFYTLSENKSFDMSKLTEFKGKVTVDHALYDSLRYPILAHRAHIEGKATSAFSIDKDSIASRIFAIRSDNKLLEKGLEAYLDGKRFYVQRPKTKPQKGKPKLVVWGVIEVEWKLKPPQTK